MSTLFVADLHLDPSRPALTRAFIKLIEHKAIHCDALYLLGDIFEAWIGDDFISPEFLPVVDALQTLSSSQCEIFFQHGNRDFLIGSAFASTINAKILSDNEVIDTGYQRALIMHGDQLCTDDHEYQTFRALVRSPAWQQSFLAQSIEQRLAIAKQLRQVSAEQGALKTAEITDVAPQAVINAIISADVPLLIHGHTHRPCVHQLPEISENTQRIVLGDWGESLWYLECNKQGNHLVELNIEQYLNA